MGSREKTSVRRGTRFTAWRLSAVLAVAAVVAAGGALAACSDGGGVHPAGEEAGGDAGAPDTASSADGPDAGQGDSDAAHPADAGTSPDGALDGAVEASPDAAPEAGPPSLVALTVTGASPDGGAPLALTPAFSPDVHDYAVRCAAGTNVLSVTMTASGGADSLLVQPVASPALPSQSLSVGVTEDQAVVAAATNGTATVEYWVRCLPHDFPAIEWTPHAEAGAPPPGYYLIGTALPTASGCFAVVLDTRGVPVWYTRATPVDGWCVFDVDSQVPGTISFDSLVDDPTEFELHQLSPLATTTVAPAGLNTDLHELRALPNGDYLVISTPLQNGVDLTGMQLPLPDGGVETLSGPQTIMACNLVETKPDGTVVWTWSATDHFDAVADSVAPELAPYGPAGTISVIDPFHCNAVDVDEPSGNLLVSAREMNSIFYVEKATGRVLWKMGGATASKDGATYVSVADPFALQHDARLQPDWSSSCNGGSGHVSLFDDETYGQSKPARGVVYDIVVGAGDASAADGGSGEAGSGDAGCPQDGGGAPGTATVSWQYAASGPTLAMGSFRILPDGSRVIGWGLVPGEGFTEVDEAGHDLVDMGFGDGNTTYRAIKVPPSAFDLDVLRSTAGLP